MVARNLMKSSFHSDCQSLLCSCLGGFLDIIYSAEILVFPARPTGLHVEGLSVSSSL